MSRAKESVENVFVFCFLNPVALWRNHKQWLNRSDSSGLGLGSVAAHSSLLRKRKDGRRGRVPVDRGQLAERRPPGLG